MKCVVVTVCKEQKWKKTPGRHLKSSSGREQRMREGTNPLNTRQQDLEHTNPKNEKQMVMAPRQSCLDTCRHLRY